MRQPELTRRRIIQTTTGAALAGLTGCLGTIANEQPAEDDQPGHGEEPHGHDLVGEPKASQEVLVNTARFEDSTEFHFDPHVTWVEPGGTVTWRLESGTHTATAYHPGNDQPRLVPEGTEAWDSGILSEPGETFEHTFETEGVYHYLCEPHEDYGMLATVIVGEPHLEDQRALQMMPEAKPEVVHGKLQELNSLVREIMGEGHDDDEEGHDEEENHNEEEGHNEEAGSDGHDEEDTHNDS